MALVKKTKIAATAASAKRLLFQRATKPQKRRRAPPLQGRKRRSSASRPPPKSSPRVERGLGGHPGPRPFDGADCGRRGGSGRRAQEQSAAIKRIVANLVAARARSRAVEAPLRDFDGDVGGCHGADRGVGARDRAQRRAPTRVGQSHHRARAARKGHRRDHASGQPNLRSDEPAGVERGDRGGSRRRSRPRLRGRRRRSARARGNVRQERAGSAQLTGAIPAKCSESSPRSAPPPRTQRKEAKGGHGCHRLPCRLTRDDVAKVAEGSRQILASTRRSRARRNRGRNRRRARSRARPKSSRPARARRRPPCSNRPSHSSRHRRRRRRSPLSPSSCAAARAPTAPRSRSARPRRSCRRRFRSSRARRRRSWRPSSRSIARRSSRPRPRSRRRPRWRRSRRAPSVAETNIRDADERVRDVEAALKTEPRGRRQSRRTACDASLADTRSSVATVASSAPSAGRSKRSSMPSR